MVCIYSESGLGGRDVDMESLDWLAYWLIGNACNPRSLHQSQRIVSSGCGFLIEELTMQLSDSANA